MTDQTIERRTETIPIDEHFPAKIEQLKADGWEYDPATPPVAVYNLFRRSGVEPQFKMRVDDSKITIIGPDGRPR